jgi:hypothetical protein
MQWGTFNYIENSITHRNFYFAGKETNMPSNPPRKLMLEQRKKVESFIHSIKNEEDGFSLGKPWRYTDNSLACVVPIHHKGNGESPYLTLPETTKVKIEDTGSIHKAKVINGEEKPVFIRIGELLKGSTQERSVTSSRIILPGEEVEIDIVCVHASKGIRTGAKFEFGGYTPKRDVFYLNHSFITGQSGGVNQQTSWNADRNYTMETQSFMRSYTGRHRIIPSDDITVNCRYFPPDDITQVRDKVNELLEDVIKAVPLFEDQTGLILIDPKGFHSLDCYNLMQPYKAVKDALVGKESTVIADRSAEEGVFDYNPEKAKDTIGKAMGKEFDEKVIHESERTKTITLAIEGFMGEAVILDDQVIHLLLARKDN